MTSYLDKTWCPYWEICVQGKDCPRALTTEVINAAKEWWGSTDAPVSLYADEPYCLERKIPLDFAAEAQLEESLCPAD